MSLNDIVSVTITTGTAAVTQAGFGTPLIAGYHAEYADTVRTYDASTGLTDLVSDGFSTSDPIYLAAQALLAQSPRVSSFKVGKLSTSSTQTVQLTPIALNDHVYSITIGGETATYTSDSTALVSEITAGLQSAINGLSVAVTATDNTTHVTVAADVANTAFVYSDYEHANLQVLDVSTAQGDMAGDLAAISVADDSWYCLLLAQQPEADILAAAAYIEAQKKIFLCDSADYEILSGSSTDVASDLATAAYSRTAIMYLESLGQYGAAAWAGKQLTTDPGSENWAYKTLAGISSYSLTSTERSNAESKRANHYEQVAGLNVTRYGTTSSASQGYIDIPRLIDWVQSRIQENVLSALANNQKIPYTNGGIALIKGVVSGVLEEGIANGAIALDPAYTVSAPDAADVSAADKANRLLPDVLFTATITGAVNKIQITGTLSV